MHSVASISTQPALSRPGAPADTTQAAAPNSGQIQLEFAEATARRWALKHLCRQVDIDEQAVFPALEQIVLLPPALYRAEREQLAQRLGWSPDMLDDTIRQFSARYEQELAKLVAPMVPTSDTKQSPAAGGRQKFTEAALQVLDKSGVPLWVSREGKPFITLSLKGVTGHYSLESKSGASALRVLLNAEAGLFTSKDQLADLVDQLAARAMVSDEVHDVCLRTASIGGAVYLDLGSSSGRVVRIDHTGWTLIEMRDCPARFWRPAGMGSMPEPVEDHDPRDFLDRIRDYANLPDRGPLHQNSDLLDPGLQADVTLLMTLPSWIRRSGVVPHLALAGRPGSGKTTAARLVRKLVDPQAADVLPAPRKLLDIAVAARNQALLVYDNLSKVPPETADMFCMLATGGAHGARTLYEDGEMTSWSILCPVIMTSVVTDVVSRVDLLDRVMVLTLTPLAKRRTDAALRTAWEAGYPGLFASLLNAVAGGLKELRDTETSVSPDDLPRLAEPAMFAEAVARGLGWSPGLLLQAVRASRQAAQGDLLEDDPLVARLIKVIHQHKGRWRGTAAELLDEIHRTTGPSWGLNGGPCNGRGMRAALDRVAEALVQAYGWTITMGHGGRGKNRQRIIQIQAPDAARSQPDPGAAAAADDDDDEFPF
jgi:hypothetical protein